MGRDKAQLPYQGERFLERLVRELSRISPPVLSVSSPEQYGDVGCRRVCDRRHDVGPLEGIRQVLAAGEEEYIFICSTDMPRLTAELVEYLAQFISSDYDCFCVSARGMSQPLCAIYARAALPAVERQMETGSYRLRDLLKRLRTKEIPLEWSRFDLSAVDNVNTPEEYAQLLGPIRFCVSGWKNSGKTRLMERLIRRFCADGYRVRAIKHDGHDFVLDDSGTDSARFAQAGAAESVIFSQTHYGICGIGSLPDRWLWETGGDVDVIIIEGLKHSPLPKVEVLRGDGVSACPPETLICQVRDRPGSGQETILQLDAEDTEGIYRAVLAYFGRS